MPELCWRIREWDSRYEVNDKGRAWQKGEAKRAGRLDYYRSKVNGDCDGRGCRKLRGISGNSRYMTVFGIFHKLLELAACRCQEDRGWLLTDDGNPATSETLAFDLQVPKSQIEMALKVLSHNDLRWIEAVPFRESPEIPGSSPQSVQDRSQKTELKQSTALVGSDSEPTPEPPIAPDAHTPEEVFSSLARAWNNCPADQVSRLKYLDADAPANADRLRRLRKAMAESADWPATASEAIEVIRSGGCAGWFGCNDRGWKPDFGFLFERGKLGKILDGSYAPKAGGNGGGHKTWLEKDLERI